ncbi:MAG: undecaprenyl/decaprenyl-phosphate alpha-N-acetylglucosaminyl 1-phosphate transferase [Chitinophagaceae bacterium]|nr:undecaprenyl/decaprenyl-phosphate alpha-N-acetylglucosaminyl 1-phosphate transferase [Chitinophagaceae bacterium]
MNDQIQLLQLNLHTSSYRFALLCFITAFIVTLLSIPPVIAFIRKFKLYDKPNARKEHSSPIPTMGGIAVIAGMMAALFLWFPFFNNIIQTTFFFSIAALLVLGIFDDLKDISAKYKFVIQTGFASLVALSGIRITSLEGLFTIYELPVSAQYSFTILTLVGITNAFNLIDGIDGLAGGLGFMSLITLGIFLTVSGDANTALIAFALAGALLAFLYFNLNPARIFMGDTGSLVLGFVIAILCVRLMQVNLSATNSVIAYSPVFVLSIVLIPVFDTLRVFGVRMWKGKSPFSPDKTHIHHLLTNQGFSHAFAAKVISILHAFILLNAIWLKNTKQELTLIILFALMVFSVYIFKNLTLIFRRKEYYSRKPE